MFSAIIGLVTCTFSEVVACSDPESADATTGAVIAILLLLVLLPKM